MRRHEVGDTDRADLAVGVQLLQRLVCVDGQFELAGQRLVQDQQVDLLDTELAGRLVEGVQRAPTNPRPPSRSFPFSEHVGMSRPRSEQRHCLAGLPVSHRPETLLITNSHT
jgi:hypothetical protein